MDPTTYYTVLDIATGDARYKGTSLHGAACALKPGTVYGTNTAQAGATLEAQRQRKLALTRKGKAVRYRMLPERTQDTPPLVRLFLRSGNCGSAGASAWEG
jgi:hypothetical protein